MLCGFDQRDDADQQEILNLIEFKRAMKARGKAHALGLHRPCRGWVARRPTCRDFHRRLFRGSRTLAPFRCLGWKSRILSTIFGWKSRNERRMVGKLPEFSQKQVGKVAHLKGDDRLRECRAFAGEGGLPARVHGGIPLARRNQSIFAET